MLAPNRFRLEFGGEDAARAQILEGCQKLAPVTSFGSSSLTLEEAYLKLMQGNPAPGPASS
ncbi:MAG TPA: hypothetical protein VGS23_01300, partial [Thermoplasmata archaeon]|nr:hypothetical protein [Thermoplasmata archaeon]